MRQSCSKATALPFEVGPPACSTTVQRVVAKARTGGPTGDTCSSAAMATSKEGEAKRGLTVTIQQRPTQGLSGPRGERSGATSAAAEVEVNRPSNPPMADRILP